MKKNVLLFAFYFLNLANIFAQDFKFYNTGNARNWPYGYFDWSWNTSSYKKFNYTSPVDYYGMPYRLMFPPNNNPNQKYPLFIMLHGGGEGMGTECSNTRGVNECQLVWGGKIAIDSSSKYPSYVFFPQTWGAWWGNANGPHYEYLSEPEPPMRAVIEIVENILLKNYNIDPDRVYLAGLSNGAKAAWELVERRPDLFAAVTPFNGMGSIYQASKIINNPIWDYQGGQDNNPNPFETEEMYNAIAAAGGNPRRSLYIDRDHWVWVDAYQSKTWLNWVYSQDKKKINILFGKGPQLPASGGLSIGISYGYKGYQWKLNGVAIPGANGYVYNATSNGTYTVAFQRFDNSWGESFPLVIGNSVPNNAPNVNAGADKSLTLPANTTTLNGTATDTDGMIVSYSWTQLGGPIATLSGANTSSLSLSNLTVGVYTFRLTATDNGGKSAADDVVVTVNNSNNNSLSVTGLTLADADADVDIGPLTSGSTIDLGTQKYNITFVAQTNPSTIGSVLWIWDGKPFKTVQIKPYSFTDNCWPNYICYNGWWRPTVGTHTLTAVPYSGTGATGTAGTPYSIQLKVINSNPAARMGEDGTSEAPLFEVLVGPNPAKDFVTIDMNNVEEELTISLADNLGRTMLTRKYFQTSGSSLELPKDLPAGLYYLNISTSSSNKKTVKITKE